MFLLSLVCTLIFAAANPENFLIAGKINDHLILHNIIRAIEVVIHPSKKPVRYVYQSAGSDGVIEWRQVGILADTSH